MELDKFINLLATIFGTFGAIYVMIGILNMTPEIMEKQTHSSWDFSLPQIENMAKQKADSIAGFVFIICAFVFTLINIVFVPSDIEVFKNKVLALLLASILAGVVFISLNYISSGIYKNQKMAVCKIITSKLFDRIIEKGSLDINYSQSLEVYAEKLLELKISDYQNSKDLFYKVGEVLNKDIPATLDFSQLPTKKKKSSTQQDTKR